MYNTQYIINNLEHDRQHIKITYLESQTTYNRNKTLRFSVFNIRSSRINRTISLEIALIFLQIWDLGKSNLGLTGPSEKTRSIFAIDSLAGSRHILPHSITFIF